MTFLRTTTKTLGAVAIAGGAVLCAGGPAGADGLDGPPYPQGPYEANCEHNPYTGQTTCWDWYPNQEQCQDAAEYTSRNGGAIPYSALCLTYADEPGVTLQTMWEDDITPRV